MQDLEIVWPNGRSTFRTEDSPILVGRSSSSTIVLPQGSVSRRHLKIAWQEGAWTVSDSSTHGTFDSGGAMLPKTWTISADGVANVGGTEGAEISFNLISATPSAAPDPSIRTNRIGADDFEISGRVPVPALEADLGPNARTSQNPANVSEAILRLSVDGQDYSFSPRSEITIGRDRSCTVNLAERHSLVSRQHLRIIHQDGSWWLEDFSSKGTYVDDKQLKSRYRAQGAFIVNLGDREAGTQVRIITSGTHIAPKKRGRALPPVLIGIVVAAIAVAAYLLLFRGGNSTQVDAVDATTAQTSTVMLVTIENGQVAGHSSGFMVTDDLIVTTGSITNGTTPSLVGITNQAGSPAKVSYATSWVASHPFLDLAVLKVATSTRESDGGYVMNAGLDREIGIPSLGIDRSSDVGPGEKIYVTGFPASPNITSTDKGVLELPASTTIDGTIVGFETWPGCDPPTWEGSLAMQLSDSAACSDSGKIEKALVSLKLSNGSAGPGSPVILNGKVVAVILGQDGIDSSVTHATTSVSFAPWLDEVIGSRG